MSDPIEITNFKNALAANEYPYLNEDIILDSDKVSIRLVEPAKSQVIYRDSTGATLDALMAAHPLYYRAIIDGDGLRAKIVGESAIKSYRLAGIDSYEINKIVTKIHLANSIDFDLDEPYKSLADEGYPLAQREDIAIKTTSIYNVFDKSSSTIPSKSMVALDFEYNYTVGGSSNFIAVIANEDKFERPLTLFFTTDEVPVCINFKMMQDGLTSESTKDDKSDENSMFFIDFWNQIGREGRRTPGRVKSLVEMKKIDKYLETQSNFTFNIKPDPGKNLGQMRLGLVWLPVHPSNITVIEQNSNEEIPTIRTPGSPILKTPFMNKRIEVTAFFPSLKHINESFRPLLAQFIRMPFLPIENEHVEALLIDGVAPNDIKQRPRKRISESKADAYYDYEKEEGTVENTAAMEKVVADYVAQKGAENQKAYNAAAAKNRLYRDLFESLPVISTLIKYREVQSNPFLDLKGILTDYSNELLAINDSKNVFNDSVKLLKNVSNPDNVVDVGDAVILDDVIGNEIIDQLDAAGPGKFTKLYEYISAYNKFYNRVRLKSQEFDRAAELAAQILSEPIFEQEVKNQLIKNSPIITDDAGEFQNIKEKYRKKSNELNIPLMCSLEEISVASVPGFADSVQCTMVLDLFNHFPYMPQMKYLKSHQSVLRQAEYYDDLYKSRPESENRAPKYHEFNLDLIEFDATDKLEDCEPFKDYILTLLDGETRTFPITLNDIGELDPDAEDDNDDKKPQTKDIHFNEAVAVKKVEKFKINYPMITRDDNTNLGTEEVSKEFTYWAPSNWLRPVRTTDEFGSIRMIYDQVELSSSQKTDIYEDLLEINNDIKKMILSLGKSIITDLEPNLSLANGSTIRENLNLFFKTLFSHFYEVTNLLLQAQGNLADSYYNLFSSSLTGKEEMVMPTDIYLTERFHNPESDDWAYRAKKSIFNALGVRKHELNGKEYFIKGNTYTLKQVFDFFEKLNAEYTDEKGRNRSIKGIDILDAMDIKDFNMDRLRYGDRLTHILDIKNSKTTTITGVSSRLLNRFAHIPLESYSIPTKQHLGRSNWHVQLNIQTSNKKLLQTLSAWSKSATDTVVNKNGANLKWSSYGRAIEVPADTDQNGVFKMLGINHILFDGFEYSTIESKPGWWNISLRLVQADVDISITEKLLPWTNVFETKDMEAMMNIFMTNYQYDPRNVSSGPKHVMRRMRDVALGMIYNIGFGRDRPVMTKERVAEDKLVDFIYWSKMKADVFYNLIYDRFVSQHVFTKNGIVFVNKSNLFSFQKPKLQSNNTQSIYTRLTPSDNENFIINNPVSGKQIKYNGIKLTKLTEILRELYDNSKTRKYVKRIFGDVRGGVSGLVGLKEFIDITKFYDKHIIKSVFELRMRQSIAEAFLADRDGVLEFLATHMDNPEGLSKEARIDYWSTRILNTSDRNILKDKRTATTYGGYPDLEIPFSTDNITFSPDFYIYKEDEFEYDEIRKDETKSMLKYLYNESKLMAEFYDNAESVQLLAELYPRIADIVSSYRFNSKWLKDYNIYKEGNYAQLLHDLENQNSATLNDEASTLLLSFDTEISKLLKTHKLRHIDDIKGDRYRNLLKYYGQARKDPNGVKNLQFMGLALQTLSYARDLTKLRVGDNTEDREYHSDLSTRFISGLNSMEQISVMPDEFVGNWGVYTPFTIMETERMFTQAVDAADATHMNNQGSQFSRAFPTVKLFFIEEDSDRWGMLDDYYMYSSIQDIRVVSSAESASKTATVTITNLANNLTRQSALNEIERTPQDSTNQEQNVRSLFTREGTTIMIKAGYDNNPGRLKTIFIGKVVSVQPGDVITLVAQSFGAELHEKVLEGRRKKYGLFQKPRTHGDVLIRLVSSMSGFKNFGGYSLWEFLGLEDQSGSGLFKPYPMFFDNSSKKGKWLRWVTGLKGIVNTFLGFDSFDPRFENIYLPYTSFGKNYTYKDVDYHPNATSRGGIFKTFDWFVDDQSLWEVLNEMALFRPNHIVTTFLYNDGMPGMTKETVYFGPRDGVYKYTDRFDRLGDDRILSKIKERSVNNLLHSDAVRVLFEKEIEWYPFKEVKKFLGIGKRKYKVSLYDAFLINFDAIIVGANEYINEAKNQTKLKDDPNLENNLELLKTTLNQLSLYVPYDSNTLDKNGKIKKQPTNYLNISSSGVNQYINDKKFTRLGRDHMVYRFISNDLKNYKNKVIGNIGARFLKASDVTLLLTSRRFRNLSYDAVQYLLEETIKIAKEWNNYNSSFRSTIKSPRTREEKRSAGFAKKMLLSINNPDDLYEFKNGKIRLEPGYKNIREYHYLDSYRHIVSNEIRATSESIYNKVTVKYNTEPFAKGKHPSLSTSFHVDDDIRDIRDYVTVQRNIDPGWHFRKKKGKFGKTRGIIEGLARGGKGLATANIEIFTGWADGNFPTEAIVGYNVLANQMRPMYRGELTIMGDPTIKPYDICFIQDFKKNMWGPIEVAEVRHVYNQSGFITVIVPYAVVDSMDPKIRWQIESASLMRVLGFAKGLKTIGWTAGLAVTASALIPGSGSLITSTLSAAAATGIGIGLPQVPNIVTGQKIEMNWGIVGAGIGGALLKKMPLLASKIPLLFKGGAAVTTAGLTGTAVTGASWVLGIVAVGVSAAAVKFGSMILTWTAGKFMGRECLDVIGLWYNGEPFVAGLHGMRRNTIQAHLWGLVGSWTSFSIGE